VESRESGIEGSYRDGRCEGRAGRLAAPDGVVAVGSNVGVPGAAAIGVNLASILAKLFLAIYKFRMGSYTQSSMLIADAQNMRNDILISVTVLISLFAGGR
jgi:divalent metal cation (Fe/Co/Zn/Cd) transporter